MRSVVWLVLVWLGTALLAPAASALSCPRWQRLGPDQRSASIERMIDRAVRSHDAQRYQVNLLRVRQCLERNARAIEDDFDAACADRRSAGMQALDNVFKQYVWSCVR